MIFFLKSELTFKTVCGKGWSGCDGLCNVVVVGAAIFRGFVYTGAARGEILRVRHLQDKNREKMCVGDCGV